MLENAYLLAKIGADTAQNERSFAENVPKFGSVRHVGGSAPSLSRGDQSGTYDGREGCSLVSGERGRYQPKKRSVFVEIFRKFFNIIKSENNYFRNSRLAFDSI